MSDRILMYPELKRLKGVPYSRQHLAKLEKAGLWPKRVQYGPGRVGWWESEIDERNRDLPRGTLPCGITNGTAEK